MDLGDSLSVVSHVICSEMNTSLSASFSLDEVKVATFQIGALKSPGPDVPDRQIQDNIPMNIFTTLS